MALKYSQTLRRRMRKHHNIPMLMTPFPLPPSVEGKEIHLDSENFEINPPKPCPLCPPKCHHYKLYWGLLRHVIREHYYDANYKAIGYGEKDKVRYLRKWLSRYSKYHDIPVKNNEQVELMIYHYAKDWNPSARGFE